MPFGYVLINSKLKTKFTFSDNLFNGVKHNIMAYKSLLFLINIFLFFSVNCYLNAQISSFPYAEDFEAGNGQSDAGGWTSGGTNSSWVLGYLNPYFLPSQAPLTYAPFGDHAWVTHSYGNYNNNENSWVQSPVFDLSSLTTPHIQLKIWYDCQTSEDGAVLQSSIDSGTSWQNVGDVGGGTNWFNNASISSSPGNQSKGWSGAYDEFTPSISEESKGWVTAIYPISNLATNNVIFRIAFSSNGSIEGPGFAFDYIQISNSSCYAGDNLKPLTVYNLEDIKDLNNLFLITGKSSNSKKPQTKKYRFKRGPRKVFVRDGGILDFPNTGSGLYQEYVFEYTDDAISCNGIKDVGYIIVKVGGNDYGGTNIEEHGCYITDDEGVQLSDVLYDALSLEAIRCTDQLYNGIWYKIEGNIETEISSETTVSQGTYKYEGCSINTAIINITTENNCDAKDLRFSFENAKKTFNGTDYFFEVDVMIQTEYTGTFKLGSGQLSFNYNTEAFGSYVNANENFEVITEGGIVSQAIDNDSNKGIYGSFFREDTSASVVTWGYSQIYSSSTFANDNVTDVQTKLCHLKIKYQDETKDPIFEFESGYPLDNQFSTACGEQAGNTSGYAYCTGEPGFLIRNDEFSSFISEITLSNQEIQLDSEFSLYPNPTTSFLNIKGSLSEIKALEVYSISGKKLIEEKNKFDKIDISYLQPSMYFVKVKTENISKTFKVIKK